MPILAYLVPRQRVVSGRSLARGHRELFLESLAVIAIVGLVLTLAVQRSAAYFEKAVLSEAMTLSTAHRVSVAETFAVTGVLPESALDGPDDRQIAGRFVERVVWVDDEIVFEFSPQTPGRDAVFGPDGGDGQNPATLSLRVAQIPGQGRLIFLCGQAPPPPGFEAPESRLTSIPEAFLPYHCRNP